MYALFDLEAHGSRAESLAVGESTTTDLFATICQRSLPAIERDPASAWQHRFSHLVPYGAKSV
jgi:hypothetical protein